MSVFAPEELAIIESCEYASSVYAPASLAQIVRASESAVAVDAPHYVYAVMSPHYVPGSYRVDVSFCFLWCCGGYLFQLCLIFCLFRRNYDPVLVCLFC